MTFKSSHIALCLGLVVAFGTQAASAQEEDSDVAAVEDQEEAPAPAPAAEPTDEPKARDTSEPSASEPIGAPPRAPSASIACTFSADGIDAASARTAAGMICDEIRARGVFVGPPSPNANGAGSAYHVSLKRLGKNVVLQLSFQSPLGKSLRHRRMILKGVEEVPIAAPRIAASLVDDTSLEDTQRVDNLVGEETRKYEKKPGEFLWGAGIQGLVAPGPLLAPGFELNGYYETPSFGVGLAFRYAGGENEKGEANVASMGVGGRYFFSQGDMSPFVGGGLEWIYAEYQKNRDDGYYDGNSGLGAYGEVGVEFLRLTGSRLTLSLHADAPFYAQKFKSYGLLGESKTSSSYFLPVSFGVTYSW